MTPASALAAVNAADLTAVERAHYFRAREDRSREKLIRARRENDARRHFVPAHHRLLAPRRPGGQRDGGE